jgi:TRAP-type C4-dicarboxylate transport system permease small subunit
MAPGSPADFMKYYVLCKLIRMPLIPRADSMRGDIMGHIGRMTDKGLEFLIIGVGSGSLILFTTLTFIEVFTRYIWGFSTLQVSAWSLFLLVWLSFGVIGIVHKEKKHIVMGMLEEYLTNSGRIKASICLDIFINVTVIIFSIIFLYLGIVIVVKAKATGYSMVIDFVPYFWLWYLALPFGTLFLLAYAIRDMVHGISRLIDLKPRRKIPNKFDQRR